MNLNMFKTFVLALSSITMIGLSGCGSTGTSTDYGATGSGEEAPTVEALHIDPPVATELIGGTVQYSVTADLSTGDTISATNEVTYTSSDEAIAVVNEGGLATATGEGEATITASYTLNGVVSTATATLTVEPTATTIEMLVSSESDFVEIGNTVQFTAQVLDESGNDIDVTSTATWTSSDEIIAIVGSTGLATGEAEGNVTITATYTYNGVEVSDTANLEVFVTEPEFISAEIRGADRLPTPFSTELDLYVTLSDGSEHHADDHADWTSSDTAIATVDESGVVTGVSEGNVTITATGKADPTKTATHDMQIGKIPTGVIIENNIIWDYDDELKLNTYKTNAQGQTGNNESNDMHYGVWYFHEVGHGFEKDQTVAETYFAFEATKNGTTSDVYVDVYVNDGTENQTVKIGFALDAASLRYPTWADFKVDHPTWTIRTNYTEKGEGRFLHGNFFLRLGSSGYELEEPFEISKYIVVKVPAAGMIVEENIVLTDAPIVITNNGLSANGTATGESVWYYHEVGNGFVEGQKVSDTGFDFDANSTDTSTYVNVYLNDGVGDHKVTLGIDNPSNDQFLTWDEVIAKYPNSTLRNFWDKPKPGTRIRGNFYLRIGDSNYVGTGAFNINKFIVVHK